MISLMGEMNIIWVFTLFFLGLLLVMKGGDYFVDSASNIAINLRIPKFIIGATIVSLATTVPELLVSSLAASRGQADMAVGNAVGSVIANTGLILGVAMIFLKYFIDRKEYMIQTSILLLSTILLFLTGRTGSVSLLANGIFLLLFVLYISYNVLVSKRIYTTTLMEEDEGDGKLAKHFLIFILGTILVVIGSNFMVTNGTKLAEYFQVPERIIAVTLVAIGTSLPELVMIIVSIVKKEPSLAIGNIIGANILNICMIMPLASFISKGHLAISKGAQQVDLPVMIGMIGFSLLPLLIRERSSKLQGLLLLTSYFAYIIYTIF